MTDKIIEADRFYSPEEVAVLLSLSVRTVLSWLRSGRLPGRKLGRVWRVRGCDLLGLGADTMSK